MNDLSKLRELVAQSCRVLGKLNLTKEPSGHVSARVPGEDRVLIKARGPEESGLRFVSARDIITVDGVPAAEIGPVRAADAAVSLGELIATGSVVAPRSRSAPRPPKPQPAPTGRSSSDVLRELRER